MKTPEKIYCDSFHSWVEDKKMIGNSVEYVRKDIAEQMAKEFAVYYERYISDEVIKGYYTLDELFDEFT